MCFDFKEKHNCASPAPLFLFTRKILRVAFGVVIGGDADANQIRLTLLRRQESIIVWFRISTLAIKRWPSDSQL